MRLGAYHYLEAGDDACGLGTGIRSQRTRGHAPLSTVFGSSVPRAD